MKSIISSIPKPHKFSNTPKPTFIQYRPPEDYLCSDDDIDRYTFECIDIGSGYIRDLASEGCFFDLEGGIEHV